MRLLLAVVALLLAPGVAGAAVTPGDYGGGGFSGGDATWMSGRIDTALNVRISGSTQLGCGLGSFDAQTKVAADGSFTFSRLRTTRVNGHVVRADVTVEGRFDGAAGSGRLTARVRDRAPGGKVERCGTRKPRPWKLNLRPVAGAPASPQARGAYLGLTAQTGGIPRAFALKVNRAANRIEEAIFLYTAPCQKGEIKLINNVTPGGPIAAGGAFALRERFTLVGGRLRERYRVRIDGQFTAGGVSGTLQVTAAIRRNGRTVDTCDTGPVAFAASL